MVQLKNKPSLLEMKKFVFIKFPTHDLLLIPILRLSIVRFFTTTL